MNKRHLRWTGFLLIILMAGACSDDPYAPATITFYPTLADIAAEPAADEQPAAVRIELKTSRISNTPARVNIRIEGNGAGYGNSYRTIPPQLEPGIVTLTVPAGASGTSLDFIPLNDDIFVPENYRYTITIAGANSTIRSIGQGTFELEVEDNTAPFMDYAFEDCNTTPVGPTERIVPGELNMQVSTWGCTPFGYPAETTRALEANAFGKGGTGTSNAYLVFPEIDGDQFTTLYLNMQVYSRFSGQGALTWMYSSNYTGSGDPEAQGVTWTELTDINTQLPAAGSRVWTAIAGRIDDLPSGNIHLAVRFKGGSSASSSSWRIDDFSVKGY